MAKTEERLQSKIEKSQAKKFRIQSILKKCD